jgi:hypothetical protein
MAQKTTPLRGTSVVIKLKDNTGTPLEVTLLLAGDGDLSLPMAMLQRDKKIVFTKSSSGTIMYSVVDTGVSGPAQIKFTLLVNDPENATDGSGVAVIRMLADGVKSGFFSSGVSTNPLTDNSMFTLDVEVTVTDANSATSVWAAACTVLSPENITLSGDKVGVMNVTLDLIEVPSIT